ncbi:galactokinase [Dyadobacter luteus]|uniref:Galactokinase n=1 Tax=Dyadobacter luteus TaxID=2259619 RepID=A0A3D8Y4H9_9BACT|nr:galactokinase [Dyadobacter luteus]REA57124.1 galactokinase [Dyadobacter luteus]
MQNTIIQIFKDLYQGEPVLFRAPGRINLLGEHTDYNEGFVLPAAIDREIFFAIRPNETDVCNVYAVDMKEQDSFHLTDPAKSELAWANYIRGTVQQFVKAAYAISGFDLVFGGNIPLGAGLSSSAALECGTATALNEIFELGIPKVSLALMAQKAEHEYAGVKCGIMDQFASIHGKHSNVILLDCRSVSYTYHPIDLTQYTLLLCNTGVKHSLADSEYNTRRQECEQGLQTIRTQYPLVESLRDATSAMVMTLHYQLSTVVFNRCMYVVQENERVQQAVKALANHDLKLFGSLMYQTHAGLSELYEVSCPELDLLVDLTLDRPEVSGSRMMGGGFGGCTLNLVETQHLESLTDFLSESYHRVYGKMPEVYPVKIVDGCNRLI